MTSTTSLRKSGVGIHNAFQLYLWNIKKNLSLVIAYAALLFVSFPLLEVLASEELKNDSGMYSDEFVRILYGVPFSVIAIIFTILSSLIAFSYMHNKRKTDVFGAFPVTRRGLFVAGWLSSLTISIVPMALVTAVSLLLTAVICPVVVGTLIECFLWLLLCILAVSSLLALLSVCAGSTADVVISFFAINIAWPSIIAVVYLLPQEIIPGLTSPDINYTLLGALCPSIISILGDFADLGAGFVLWWIIFIVGCAAAALPLVKRRKAECAQSGFAYGAVSVAIRIMANIICSLLCGILFSLFACDSTKAGQTIWLIIGIIVGCVLAHIILQLLYKHSFAGFKKTLWYFGASLAAVAVFFAVMCTGLFGYDTYVPEADSIEYAEVSINFETERYIDAEDSSYNVYLYYPHNYYEFGNGVRINQEEGINRLVNAHSAVTSVLKDKEHRFYLPFRSYDYIYIEDYSASQASNDIYKYFSYFDITYTLKDGSTVERHYGCDLLGDPQVMECLTELVNSEEYIKGSLALYQSAGNDRIRVVNAGIYNENSVYEETGELTGSGALYTVRNELASALAQDLLEQESPTQSVCDYINDVYYSETVIELDYTVYYDNYTVYYDEYPFEEDCSYISEYFIIDRSFKNTCKVLEDAGMDLDEVFLDKGN